jgi:hypothetical protein
MSVNWNWSDKCGELTVSQNLKEGEPWQDYKVSLYDGNCMIVMLYEYVDEKTGKEMYNFWSFFSDKTHAKNCLGLSKDSYNIFDKPYEKITKVRLNKSKCRYYKDLVSLFSQAFDNIAIEIYSDPSENSKEE